MRWACTPRGVGRAVGFRLLPEGADPEIGEFVSTSDPRDLVLADDQTSLRTPTQGEILTIAREEKLAELVEARDAAIVSPVSWSGAQWSALPDDQANLIQAVSLWAAVLALSPEDQATLGAPVPSSIPWKTIANELRDLSYLEAIQLATAISISKQTMFAIYWQLEAAVAAAELDELQAITWPQ